MSPFNTTNYAKYRRDLRGLCPHMGEREIYRNWWMSQFPDEKEIPWTVHQSPLKGVCGRYHYLYITTTPKGEIYIGIHSPRDLNDDYHGSGDEIQKYKDAGVELTTTILEFFRTREAALAMEAYVVNDLFLLEFDVLNKVPGGDDTRHNIVEEPELVATPKKYNSCPAVVEEPQHSMLLRNVSVEMPFGDKVEVPVVDDSMSARTTPVPPKKAATAAAKKTATKKYPKNWFTLERLTVPIGGKLVYIADKSIIATALNEVDRVKVNGWAGTLKEMTNKIAGKQVSNCLAYWSFNGKSLLDIKNEIIKKGG